MLVHAGGDGQNIEVKNNILRRKIQFLGEELIRALSDGHFVFDCGSLAFLIERHHHRGRAVALAQCRLAQEFFFAALETNGVYDSFALQTFEADFEHAPFGAVHHYRHARNIRIGAEQIQEAMHTRLGIEQAFVETNVDNIRAVLHLLPRERERAFEVIFLDELFELW